MKMIKLLLIVLLVTGLAMAQTGLNIFGPISIEEQPPNPISLSRVSATYAAAGAAGSITLYYWVSVTYNIGSMFPVGPREVRETAALGGGNTVSVVWPASSGAISYTIVKTTTAQFPTIGTCAACAVTVNAPTVTVVDTGGNFVNAFATSGVNKATARISIDNLNETNPTLELGNDQVTAFRVSSENNFELGNATNQYTNFASGDNLFNIDATDPGPNTARAINVRSRSVGGDMYGADIWATSIGGNLGTERVRAVQGLVFSGTGTTVISHVLGGTFRANHDNGSLNAAIGVDGILDIGAGATLNAEGFASGVQGIYLDLAGVAAVDRYTGAVTGIIWDVDTAGPQGAILAVLNGDSARTAGNSPNAAFKVIDRTTTPGVNFNYGLDMFYTSGALDTDFNIADIRGHLQSTVHNELADLWTSNSEIRVSGPAAAYLDWAARTDVVIQGFRSRISSDVSTATTTVYGGLFEVQAQDTTAGGLFTGAIGVATTEAGITGTDIFTGLTGESNPSDGLVGAGYGVLGILNIDGTTTAGLNMIVAGVKGDYEDAVGLNAATNYTAGVMGFISDFNTVGPDGAVVAVLQGGGVRTAGNSPTSAYRIIDLNETANVGFDYGFDAFWNDGVVTDSTVFNVADIRGQRQSTLNNELALLWVSQSEFSVSGIADAFLDFSAEAGVVQAFSSRLEADMATVTRVLGADFNAQSTGGAAGTERVIAMQSLAFSGVGTTAISHVIGASSRANHDTGSATAVIGVDGILDIGAAGTLNALGFASGVQGIYLDAAGVNAADNFTGAVMGIIWDIDTVGPDGAMVAVLNGDSVRTAGNSPNAAFKVMDRTTTGGVNFNFGLDLWHVDGAMSNVFNTAAIRGQALDMLNNAAAGYWTVSRGSGAFTGLTLEGTAFADLPAAANGTLIYCSNCNPAAGAGFIACATGGASSGALAVRLAGAWDCGSR